MLPPPRLPALCIGFNAAAWGRSGHASAGVTGCEKFEYLNAKPCTVGVHGYF